MAATASTSMDCWFLRVEERMIRKRSVHTRAHGDQPRHRRAFLLGLGPLYAAEALVPRRLLHSLLLRGLLRYRHACEGEARRGCDDTFGSRAFFLGRFSFFSFSMSRSCRRARSATGLLSTLGHESEPPSLAFSSTCSLLISNLSANPSAVQP